MKDVKNSAKIQIQHPTDKFNADSQNLLWFHHKAGLGRTWSRSAILNCTSKQPEISKLWRHISRDIQLSYASNSCCQYDSFLGQFTCNLQIQIESHFLHIERPVSVYIKLSKECSGGDRAENNSRLSVFVHRQLWLRKVEPLLIYQEHARLSNTQHFRF